jgi:fibro-slime domain-containing protein
VISDTTTFANWYNTVEGTNMELKGYIELTNGGFESAAFFPLDNAGFMNTPGQTHNYHFTTEAHVTFTYVPGGAQTFSFAGDDDLWIFVNGKLAMDLGGVHEPMQGTINFDTKAAELGIAAGGKFPMDIFHAERQTSESNFKVQTNIECFVPIEVEE